jgi:ubiquinone/menaquinone biosynthesis C-methylase UbiE
MSTGIEYDEAWSRRVEAIYVTSDVVAQRQAVVNMLELRPGERVLDVGSGPGLLAHDMASAVGKTGAICGIDLSDSMVALAQRRCASLPWVDFRLGDATTLPYADGEFDAAVVTQVYNYISDLPTALQELYRVLRPGGRALILDTDWDTLIWNTTDPERMRRVLAAWTEHSAHPYLPRTLAPQLRKAGFQITHQTVFPLFNPHYDTDTYSHGIIDFIATFVQGRHGITADEAQAWADELRQRSQADDYFFSLNRYVFLAVKPEAERGI